MSDHTQPDVKFEGEEAGTGYASPGLDMIAAILLILLSVAVMIGSMALPVPDDLLTAPGLLPFIVAASLMVMALGLGASAVGRWRQGVRVPILEGRDISTDVKSLILAAAIAVYIAGLQFLAFRHDVVIGDIRHSVTAFEPVTILALAVIMRMSWNGPLWIICAVSVLWTLLLSAVFQHVFNIPLPGSF
ncbi:tripartite tricarboxylate transporter TctB family protein [Roseibium sp. MMSF_3544]|uniref:tripartite tricarboxylate transporter TctB family protein n=1 Tax=unclassified Roseibium TaxID=2629323 RepID=UPI00273D05BF|nr:tripartite tricarboxylate transporter TctB family protein [Roseibium sp. MMSF_3544]